jgi:hypothetical protein
MSSFYFAEAPRDELPEELRRWIEAGEGTS